MKKQVVILAALCAFGVATAQAAQFAVSAGAVAGNTEGFQFQQTRLGLDGNTLGRNSYTGMQVAAGARFAALPGIVFSTSAMTSTGGASVSDLSASVGYPVAVGAVVLTPGLQWGCTRLGDQSYSRAGATLAASYAITPSLRVFAAGVLGKTNGMRDLTGARGRGDYRSTEFGAAYDLAPGQAVMLAYGVQTIATADLGALGMQDASIRALSVSYVRAF